MCTVLDRLDVRELYVRQESLSDQGLTYVLCRCMLMKSMEALHCAKQLHKLVHCKEV